MKRYICASKESTPDIFNLDTDTSYYNNFLNQKDLAYMQKAKNRTGEVVYMTPAQYYQECADNIFEDVTVANLKLQRSSNSDFVERYKQAMLDGDKFPLCYLNYADNSQEGLHRMMAAGEAFGWDTKFPVLVVKAVDSRVEELNRVWRYWNQAVSDAEEVTYREDRWEEEFVEEVEYNLERRTDTHYDVVITERRDKEECDRLGMDYAIEIALADFVDIMHPMTVFTPELKPAQDDDSDDFEIDDDDIDWDLLTL